jgi:hypothetical protein
MSSVDRKSLAFPEQCGILVDTGVPMANGRSVESLIDVKPVRALARLRAGGRCQFLFKEGLKCEPDYVLVAWFTDDAGFRWQLDEYQHLVQVDDGGELEYLQ